MGAVRCAFCSRVTRICTNTRPAWISVAGVTYHRKCHRQLAGIDGYSGNRISTGQIARLMGITRQQVSNILHSAINAIAGYLDCSKSDVINSLILLGTTPGNTGPDS